MAAYGDTEHPNQAAVIKHWDNMPKAGKMAKTRNWSGPEAR